MRKRLNLIGEIFGDLKIIEFDCVKNKKTYWIAICKPCGNKHSVCGSDVKRGKIKNCGCTLNKGHRNGQWKGYKELSGRIVSHYKEIAELRNIKFKITAQDMWNQYVKQNMVCPYTGVELYLETKNSLLRTPINASLDRIDSKKHYTVDNIQWVLKKVNVIKNDLTHNEFIELCHLISKNCPIPYSKNKKNGPNKP